MHRATRALLPFVVCALAVVAGCNDDATRLGGDGAPCETDQDCLNGYYCLLQACTPEADFKVFDVGHDEMSLDTSAADGVPSDTPTDATSDGDGDVEEVDGYDPSLPCRPGDTKTCGFDIGACTSAVQECTPEGWTPCQAVTPSPEVCDGVDNNCNGQVDDNVRRDCGTDVGICAKGLQSCVAGVWGSCKDAVDPIDELCDGQDNDCNGVIDDGASRACVVNGCAGLSLCVVEGPGEWGDCVATNVGNEVCDGVDNDCNGLVDEGVARACAVNGCAGTQLCVEGGVGQWASCVATSTQPEACDGLDNDCNGLVDEGLVRPCSINGCGGLERCIVGGLGQWDQCVPSSTPAETCDGVDNDCDGTVDDGVSRGCTINGCVGTQNCLVGGTGQWAACMPNSATAELCDGVDNDCDGTVDEDVSQSCIINGCAGTTACVVGGVGQWGVCAPNATPAETCDGLDNDCDGLVDDGVTRSCAIAGCAGIERCVQGGSGQWGVCETGVVLDDGIDCTDDACGVGGIVTHTANDALCAPTERCDSLLGCVPAAVCNDPVVDGTWYGHHGYSPPGNTTKSCTNQFYAVERVATRITPPSAAFPLTVTHIRALLGNNKSYTMQLLSDSGGAPGAGIGAGVDVVGDGTWKVYALPGPHTFITPQSFWVAYRGAADFYDVCGDANGEATSNWIESCLSFGSGCITPPEWSTLQSLGAPFSAIDDLIVSVGSCP